MYNVVVLPKRGRSTEQWAKEVSNVINKEELAGWKLEQVVELENVPVAVMKLQEKPF